MKKYLIIMLAGLAFAACNDPITTREFRADDNSVVAKCQFHGTDSLNAEWQITDANGNPLVPGCDSMKVVELGEDGHPATICYFKDNRQEWRQYYSTMHLRSAGAMVDGQREGHWIFYFPNGTPQAEGDFVAGKEHGSYKVYRENGIPYYVGKYDNGQRTGTWEIYDAEGNLAQTQEF